MVRYSSVYNSYTYRLFQRDDLKELPYLHYCIKEANRLYPPVPVITRGLSTSRTIEGYQLPKGIPVALQIYGCHHNPHVWNEPEVRALI